MRYFADSALILFVWSWLYRFILVPSAPFLSVIVPMLPAHCPTVHSSDIITTLLSHLLSREQQVVLVRLRTGHNRLNSHIHRKLKLASSPTRLWGQEDQTTEHVLQRYPLHKVTWEDVWPFSTLLTTKLYGCKQELNKTLFISWAALIV